MEFNCNHMIDVLHYAFYIQLSTTKKSGIIILCQTLFSAGAHDDMRVYRDKARIIEFSDCFG